MMGARIDPFGAKKQKIIENPTNFFVDIEQNTDEWMDLRMGKITSSKMGCIMANLDKAFGNPAKEYAQKIALELVTGKRDSTEGYSNKYMEMGHEREPEAILLYQVQAETKVDNGGFYYEKTTERVVIGDSPDGNVGEDGCIEVKSVSPNSHWKVLKKGGFDTAYKWQIHNHIWTGNKRWCDFISYCPDFPESKQLYIFRVERDEEIIETMRRRVNEFRKLVEDNIKILEG